MKKILSLFLILSTFTLFAQAKFVETTPINQSGILADTILGYDTFNSLYYIKENTLYKTINSAKVEYNNFSLGKISKVDFQNPLKILVFYEQFNTAVLLDKQLSEIVKYNFSQNETPIVCSAIGISIQNNLWIYNNLTQKISLYDTSRNTLKELSTVLESPIKIYKTDQNQFSWIDENGDWFSCDIYGKIKKIGNLEKSEFIQFADSRSVVYKKDNLFYFRRAGMEETLMLKNVDKSATSFQLQGDILSIFTNRQIINYKIVLP